MGRLALPDTNCGAGCTPAEPSRCDSTQDKTSGVSELGCGMAHPDPCDQIGGCSIRGARHWRDDC